VSGADQVSKAHSGNYRSRDDLEAVGGEVLAEIARDQMHGTVSVLRGKLESAMDASAKAASADNKAMRGYLRPSCSWRMKAEELHTIADHTTSARAKGTFRFLAQSYDALADRVEATEKVKAGKAASRSG
jgi:hypothetical protein